MKPDDDAGTLYHLEIPLLRPFDTASGRVVMRTVGLVSVTRRGVTGWGEAAPYPGQDESFLDVIRAAIAGRSTPTLEAAVDEAVCDLAARERGDSLAAELGAPVTDIPISVAIGMGDAAIASVEEAVSREVTRVKIKIMPGHTAHVATIKQRFPDLSVGVDANGSFDGSSWLEMLSLADVGVEYIEQPFPSLDRVEVEKLALAGLVVFADESVRSQRAAAEVLRTPGVAGLVVKPGRLGWTTSVAVVEMARAAGKRWRASGLLETGVGRAFTEALAAAPDAFPSDVASAESFFAFDVVASRANGGHVKRATGHGSGIDIDVSAVEAHAVDVFEINGSVGQALG